MISLYESILQSTKAGKRSLIENWLSDTKNVFGPGNKPLDYKIKSDNTVEVIDEYFWITFEGYDQLPEYIKFANYEGHIILGKSGSFSEHRINSFLGLPKKIKKLSIYCGTKTTCFPKLDVEMSNKFTFSGPSINMYEGLHIKFNNEDNGLRGARTLYIDFFETSFSSWKVENCDTIDLTGDDRLAKIFAKSVNQKYTKLNSKTGPLEYPIEEKGLQQMKEFFGGIDLSTVNFILLAKHIAIQKINGKFYKLRT